MSQESRPGAVVARGAPRPVGPYPHARWVGDFLFVSGMGPRQPGTDEIPGVLRGPDGAVTGHDVRVQTRATLENIRRVLEEAGSSMAAVVDVTVFLVDIAGDFAAFNEVYAEVLGPVGPTRTTVGVTGLPTPIAVELKVVAHRG